MNPLSVIAFVAFVVVAGLFFGWLVGQVMHDRGVFKHGEPFEVQAERMRLAALELSRQIGLAFEPAAQRAVAALERLQAEMRKRDEPR